MRKKHNNAYTDLPALVAISDTDEEEDDQKPAPKPQRTVEVGSNLNQRDLDIEFVEVLARNLEEGRSVFTQPVALLIAEETVANRFSDHEVEIDGMDQKKSVDWKSSVPFLIKGHTHREVDELHRGAMVQLGLGK